MSKLVFLPLLVLCCCVPLISSSSDNSTGKESSHSASKTEVLSHSTPSPASNNNGKTEVLSHSTSKTPAPSSPAANKNEDSAFQAVQMSIKKADSLSWYMDDMITNKSTTQKDRQAAQTCADKLHAARAPMKQPGFSLSKLETFLQGLSAAETDCLNLVNKFEKKAKAVVDAANNACITTQTSISVVKQTSSSQSPAAATTKSHGAPSSPADKNDGPFEAVQMSMTYANSLSWCMNGIISNKSTTQKDRQAAQTCAGRLHTVMAPAKEGGYNASKLVAFLDRLIASETDCLNLVKKFEVKITSVENEATNALQITNTAMKMVKQQSSQPHKTEVQSHSTPSPANKNAHAPSGSKSDAPSHSASKSDAPSSDKKNDHSSSKSDAPSHSGSKSDAPSSDKKNNHSSSKSDAPSHSGSKSDAPSSDKKNDHSSSKSDAPSASKSDAPSSGKKDGHSASKSDAPSSDKKDGHSSSKSDAPSPANKNDAADPKSKGN